MKILQVNCVFRQGSTGRIVDSIRKGLNEHGIENFVCYGRGEKVKINSVVKVANEVENKIHGLLFRVFGSEYGYSYFSTRKLIRIIKKFQPDIVHLHCINGNFLNTYKLLSYLKKQEIKIVLTLHAENMHTAGCEHALDCVKWQEECHNCAQLNFFMNKIMKKLFRVDLVQVSFKKMKKAFDECPNLTIVTPSNWLKERVQKSTIFKNYPCQVIPNGINTENFYKDENSNKGEGCVLHITSNFEHGIKGAKYFLEVAEKMPNQKFVVVGVRKPQHIKDSDNITFHEHTNSLAELRQYYSNADVFLMTSVCENYPTVCLEAACCGLPIVGFDVGGVKETIPINMGEAVEFSDTEKMKQAIEIWKEKKKSISSDMIEQAREMNSELLMAKRYIDLYYKITGKEL